MKSEDEIMALVWDRILSEIRALRAEKYTLERLGSMLGVSKPTVQRWLETDAGGDKTAFKDILRYLKALEIEPQSLLFGDDQPMKSEAPPELAEKEAELAAVREQLSAMTGDNLERQQALVAAQKKVIELQERVLRLERHSMEVTEKARRIAAAASRKMQEEPSRRTHGGKLYPDLPPIHLDMDEE